MFPGLRVHATAVVDSHHKEVALTSLPPRVLGVGVGVSPAVALGNTDRSRTQRLVTDGSRWRKPEAGWLKFNIDGTVKADSSAECGGVLWDDHGNWVLGFCKKLETSNALFAELSGIQVAIDIVLDNNLPRVIIE